jgi:hypothetical protein
VDLLHNPPPLLPLLELPLHDDVELDAATAVDDDAMHAKRCRCRRKKRILLFSSSVVKKKHHLERLVKILLKGFTHYARVSNM